VNNRLEELRNQFGLTQQELADQVEVSRQTIISLESGRYNPSILLAFRLARFFNLKTLKRFFFMSDEEVLHGLIRQIGLLPGLAWMGIFWSRGFWWLQWNTLRAEFLLRAYQLRIITGAGYSFDWIGVGFLIRYKAALKIKICKAPEHRRAG